MSLRSVLRSFRVRMTLLSVSLSAMVLISFAGWAWTRVHAAGLARIDEQIRIIGDRQLTRPPHERGQWRRVQESLSDVLGGDDSVFLLLVKDWEENIVHQSLGWPVSLPADSYPTPPGPSGDWERNYDPMGGRFGQGPGPGRDRRGPPPRREKDGDWDRREPPREGEGEDDWDRPAEDKREARSDGFRRPPPPRWERGDFDGRGGRRGPGPPPPPRVSSAKLTTIVDSGTRWRMGVMQSDHFTMALGISLEAFDADMARARNTFLISVAGAMLLIILGSSWLAGRALRPVTALTQTAEQVTAHGLDKRIDIGHTDAEFERLIGVFNAMLARLEESFSQAVRFSADASHELKTPLAVLQGELEAALQDSVSGSHAQAHYSRLLDEVQRLKSITRKLLLLSLADTGQLKVSRTDVDLSAIAEGAADDVEILAPKLRVDHQIEPGIHVMADPDLVRQVVHNLTSNAAKYTDESGRVRVKLRRNGTHVRFSVVNSGLGIPESERARIFDRFYRADKARGRDVEGSGLGLSLAREIARAHGGDLALDDTKPIITKFTLTLPIDG